MWSYAITFLQRFLRPKKSITFLSPCQTPGQQVRWLRAESSSAAHPCVLSSEAAPGLADRISLHPWELSTRSVFTTNHHEQLNMSFVWLLTFSSHYRSCWLQLAVLGPQHVSGPFGSLLLGLAGKKRNYSSACSVNGFPDEAELTWVKI